MMSNDDWQHIFALVSAIPSFSQIIQLKVSSYGGTFIGVSYFLQKPKVHYILRIVPVVVDCSRLPHSATMTRFE